MCATMIMSIECGGEAMVGRRSRERERKREKVVENYRKFVSQFGF